MEQVSSQEDHINISFLGQAHYFVEALPAVVPTDGISLVVADMIIGRDENSNGFRLYINISKLNNDSVSSVSYRVLQASWSTELACLARLWRLCGVLGFAGHRGNNSKKCSVSMSHPR